MMKLTELELSDIIDRLSLRFLVVVVVVVDVVRAVCRVSRTSWAT